MNIEKSLEFDQIREKWTALAVTQNAKEKIAQMTFYLSEAELRKNIKDTTDSRLMIEKCGTPPLDGLEEINDILSLANKGCCLTPYQLERVSAVLVAVKRFKDYLNRGKQYQNSLAYYEENFDSLEVLYNEILGQIRNGQVDDHASKELLQIRNEIVRSEEKMKQKAEQVMRSFKECMADNFCTYRNGRLCVPVKKECKFKVAGSVIDKSATGNTLFIEPSAVAKHYEELELLKIDEENEVQRILYVLSAMVSDYSPVMEENIKMMEKLDFIFSKGKLSVDLNASEPLINTRREIHLKNARHPLMDIHTNVPLQFEIGNAINGIIITGPNTGGKTVAIKTVALNCMMAQCGLHVTCEKADICMNSLYLCDIGDNQNLAENLSTFSAHIKNVLKILQEVNSDSLVIMDELGSGTDPTEGMGIAIATLEELKKSGCLFVVTTHYPEVKEYAEKAEGIINARMTFDKDTLQPMYQMVIGEAGESCAFYIAGKLGMPKRMLRTAICAAYGEGAADSYDISNICQSNSSVEKSEVDNIQNKIGTARIKRIKNAKKGEELSRKYNIGDSVMVFPDKKIGIVCVPINEKGVLQVQLPNKKIWINHKRVKLHVSADKLYPKDYDFSNIFDTVENRKIRHDMDRKFVEREIRYED